MSLFVGDDASCIKITNPKIIEFYTAHPSISIEKMNLLILDILQNRIDVGESAETVFSDFAKPEATRKMDELATFSKKLREAIHGQIQSIMRESSTIKSSYVCEFRAISQAPDLTAFKMNNNVFAEKMRSCFSRLLNCRSAGLADRTNAMLRQFHKILNANVDAYVSNKPANPDLEHFVMEYVSNFDSNTGHMINAICQLLSDYCASKDAQSQTLIESMKRREENSGAYYKIVCELNDFLYQFGEDKDPSSSSQPLLNVVISKTFPTASVYSDASFHVIARDDRPSVVLSILENKDRNVGTEEVKSFLKIATDKNMSGILASQYTGISSKSDYQIEIQNNRVIVYLHQLDVNTEKLQIAVDMIDSLTTKLEEFGSNMDNKYSVPKDVLDDINREYQTFIVQKEAMVGLIKEQYKRSMAQMDEIRFSSLDKFLSTRYSSYKKQGHICDLCHVFNVPTLKGLAAHKRGCARKLASLTCAPVNTKH